MTATPASVLSRTELALQSLRNNQQMQRWAASKATGFTDSSADGCMSAIWKLGRVSSVNSGWPVIDDNGRLALGNGRDKKRDSCPRSGVIAFADPSLKRVFGSSWMRITRAVTPRGGPRASLAHRGCSMQAALCQPAKGRQQRNSPDRLVSRQTESRAASQE